VPQLSNRIALITGASTGIGRAIAGAYAAEGARLVLAARHADKLEAAAEEIRRAGGEARAMPADITNEGQVARLFEQTLAAHGRLDILVNNAGISVTVPTEDLDLADWRRVMETNVTGAFLCSRAALGIMKKQRGGRIINIGSVAAQVSRPHSAAYTTSKFALDGLTRSLALDGRAHGIAVSILHPGNTVSEIWGDQDEGQREGMMSASDVARVAVMIASLPATTNLLESTMLPLTMPFLGRG
jgi:NAD(P)-dependent dehydrogenase (short-subunit alcohol dehydrogenase family)